MGLILKAQSNFGEQAGLIQVVYSAANEKVQVWTGSAGWTLHESAAASFTVGDQLRAVALATGLVEVYKNETLLLTADVTAWPYYAQGGYIGLSFWNASDAVIDDFGGGTVALASGHPGSLPLARTFPFGDLLHTLWDNLTVFVTGLFAPQATSTPVAVAVRPKPRAPLPTANLSPSPDDAPARLPDDLPTATVITYTYDPLYRLTGAYYDNGFSYLYEYDAVGNRTNQQACLTGYPCNATAYTYDHANRMTSANDGTGPKTYIWHTNGNLLFVTGDNTSYTYTPANHLSQVSEGGNTSTYQYNGLGDRLQQTVNSQTTNYTLDLARGLTQVLDDGTHTYLYGNMRLAQKSTSSTEYFLTDALGSVRQMVDETGTLTLAQAYQPYGETLGSAGSGATSFGFTGVNTDSYIK